MEIEYKGANAVILTTKNTRIVFDPKLSLVGGKDVPVNDCVEVVTDRRFTTSESSPKLLIDGPGEYEIGDISILGVAAQKHIDTDMTKNATIYKLSTSDIRGAVIGNIAPKLSEEQLEQIGVVDFVIIPVGGNGYTLDPSDAASMVHQLDPKVVIPIHFADQSIKYEVPQAELSMFTGELGVSILEAGYKWKLKKAADLPESITLVEIRKS